MPSMVQLRLDSEIMSQDMAEMVQIARTSGLNRQVASNSRRRARIGGSTLCKELVLRRNSQPIALPTYYYMWQNVLQRDMSGYASAENSQATEPTAKHYLSLKVVNTM